MVQNQDAQVHADERGLLTVLEFSKLPWKPERAYFLSSSTPGLVRGAHSHKELRQYFLALKGKWNLEFFDGKSWTKVQLENEGQGVLVEPGLWREISTSDPGAVLGVFASLPYDESDYIRNLDEFKKWSLN